MRYGSEEWKSGNGKVGGGSERSLTEEGGGGGGVVVMVFLIGKEEWGPHFEATLGLSLFQYIVCLLRVRRPTVF